MMQCHDFSKLLCTYFKMCNCSTNSGGFAGDGLDNGGLLDDYYIMAGN
jgi:hypothetical protein